jgi:hypothetical protein
MLSNTRLAIKLLEDEEIEEDDEWCTTKNNKSDEDFEKLFDLNNSSSCLCFKIDIFSLISNMI